MNLSTRSTADERMDTDCVDFADYRRCLRDLSRVNTLTLTHRPMLAWLANESRGLNGFSLIDVGCGHGDALRRIHRWSLRHRLAVQLEGLDLNPWAARAAQEATELGTPISYRTGDVFATEPSVTFDFIISSQFTHHLSDTQVVTFIRWMEQHARRGWFIGDLHRHWLPYYGFGILGWIARWHSFVRSDGRVSIARGFVSADWREFVQAAGLTDRDVDITWHLPFRLCVQRHCPDR